MRTLLIVALVGGAANKAAAQWYVGVEVSTTRYGGSSHDTSSTHAASEGHPGSATALHLRFGRNGRRYGLALRAARSKPGLALTGGDINVTDKSAGSVWEVALSGSARVRGIGPSGAIRVELGPALHFWSFQDVRTRLGANGAVSYEWLVTGRFTGAARLEGMLSKSWFDPGDVPPEYERRVTWRYGVGLGLRYRL